MVVGKSMWEAPPASGTEVCAAVEEHVGGICVRAASGWAHSDK